MNDRHEMLTDYLLGELTDEQRAEFEQQIARDPELAAEVAELGQVVTRLESLPDEAWAEEDPPPFIVPVSADSPQGSSRPGALRGFLDRSFTLRPAFALAAAVLLFAGGIGVGSLTRSDDSAPSLGATGERADLSPVADIDPQATGTADIKRDGKLIRLRLSGLAPNGDDDFYEAWLMDPKNGLVAIGTFRVDRGGGATIDLPLPVGTDRFPLVDISLQPTNGKPTHSGVSVLRGKLQS